MRAWVKVTSDIYKKPILAIVDVNTQVLKWVHNLNVWAHNVHNFPRLGVSAEVNQKMLNHKFHCSSNRFLIFNSLELNLHNLTMALMNGSLHTHKTWPSRPLFDELLILFTGHSEHYNVYHPELCPAVSSSLPLTLNHPTSQLLQVFSEASLLFC